MNPILRWTLVLILSVSFLFHGGTALRILLPWNFSYQATPVTIKELAAGKYPDGGYLEVKDGYLAPYRHGPHNSGEKLFIGERPGLYQLLTKEDVEKWIAQNPDYSIDFPDAILVWVEPEQLSQFWPEVGDGSTSIDARTLRSVQRSLTGDVETISYSYPPATIDLDPSASRTYQVMYFERHQYGPWNLAKSLIFTACMLSGIITLLNSSRNTVLVEADPEFATTPGSTRVVS